MFKEITFGGKYVTIIKTNKNNVDSLTIQVFDIVEMIKEIGNEDNPKAKTIKEWYTESNWNNAVIDAVDYLVDSIIDLEIYLNIKIDVDYNLINWEKDFDYEKLVKINRNSVLLNFIVRKNAWCDKFVRTFVEKYNKKIGEIKNESKR